MALVGELEELKMAVSGLKTGCCPFFANVGSFYKNEVKYKYIYLILFVTKR